MDASGVGSTCSFRQTTWPYLVLLHFLFFRQFVLRLPAPVSFVFPLVTFMCFMLIACPFVPFFRYFTVARSISWPLGFILFCSSFLLFFLCVHFLFPSIPVPSLTSPSFIFHPFLSSPFPCVAFPSPASFRPFRSRPLPLLHFQTHRSPLTRNHAISG